MNGDELHQRKDADKDISRHPAFGMAAQEQLARDDATREWAKRTFPLRDAVTLELVDEPSDLGPPGIQFDAEGKPVAYLIPPEPEPKDAFGAHITDGVIGRIGDREIGPGHVVLSEERYQWLLGKAGITDDLVMTPRFDAFVQGALEQILKGLELSYEEATRNWREVFEQIEEERAFFKAQGRSHPVDIARAEQPPKET